MVGSSILFVYCDRGSAAPRCKLIDFAKTSALDEGRTLSHRSEWVVGNREDGYLSGLDSLIATLEGLELTEAAGDGEEAADEGRYAGDS